MHVPLLGPLPELFSEIVAGCLRWPVVVEAVWQLFLTSADFDYYFAAMTLN
jgi:hypothetical protein